MAIYQPVSRTVPQYSVSANQIAAGYYLKGYLSGTTTPLSMATDAAGGTTIVKCKLNTAGYPLSNDSDDSTVFIPHFNADFKLALYANSTDADNDTTGNAVWVVDAIPIRPEATITFTSTDATPTVTAGNSFITAGTTAITDFDDGHVGQTIKISAASSITITDGSAVGLKHSTNFDMVSGDTLTLHMFVDQVWEEIGRSTTSIVKTAVTFTSTDATPTVAFGETFITAGTTAITDFDNGVVGQTIKILAASSIVITHGSPISLRGIVNFAMVAGDTLTLHMFNDQVWEEQSRTYAAAFTKFKTADEALTSSTLADDTHLKDWVLQANTYYRFEGYLKVNADAGSRDLEIDIVTNSAFVEECYSWISVDAGNALAVDQAETQTLVTAVANIDIDGTGLVGILLKGFVLTHASQSSNVDIQFANQAGAGTVTVQKGSWVSFIPYEY